MITVHIGWATQCVDLEPFKLITRPSSGASGKESGCHCRRCKRREFDPWVGKILWRRAWQPTPVFLPGESPWTEEAGELQSMGLQRVGHK